MSRKKYSLLSHRPDWRFREAISGKVTIDDCDDKLIARYLKAKEEGFSNDPELFAIIDMGVEDRGLIEAMYLGGASIDDIALNTLTDPSAVKLVLDFFYDIEGLRSSPLLRSQLAGKEMNRVVRSYKVFTAKYGWKKFLEQFLSREEALENPPSVPESQTDLMIELRKKITELGIFETGSPESKELLAWMKLMIELMRETRAHDWESEKEKNTDIGRIMSYLKNNQSLSKDKKSFELIIKGTSGETEKEDKK
jgi:hypothetical protein